MRLRFGQVTLPLIGADVVFGLPERAANRALIEQPVGVVLQVFVGEFATVIIREIRHWSDGVESGAFLHEILVVIPGEKAVFHQGREVGMAECKPESCYLFVSRGWVIVEHVEPLVPQTCKRGIFSRRRNV